MDGRYFCSSSTLGIWFGVVEVGHIFLAFENCHTHFPSDCTGWHIPVIYKGSFFLHPCRKHFFFHLFGVLVCAYRCCVGYDAAWWSLFTLLKQGLLCFCCSVYSRATSKLPGNSSVSDYHLAVSMPGYRCEPHLAFDVLWGSSSDPQVYITRAFSCRAVLPQGHLLWGQ